MLKVPFMRNMFYFGLIVLMLGATVCADLQCTTAWTGKYHGLKAARWQSIKNCTEDSPYSIRYYPSSYWITTYADPLTSESMLFMTLFEYITVNKIAMTVPVRENYVMKNEELNMKSMSFFISVDSATQLRSSAKVKVEQVPPMTVFVWQFGGYAFDDFTKLKEIENLKSELVGDSQNFNGDVVLFAGYDDPMTMYGRRNEIWLFKIKK